MRAAVACAMRTAQHTRPPHHTLRASDSLLTRFRPPSHPPPTPEAKRACPPLQQPSQCIQQPPCSLRAPPHHAYRPAHSRGARGGVALLRVLGATHGRQRRQRGGLRRQLGGHTRAAGCLGGRRDGRGGVGVVARPLEWRGGAAEGGGVGPKLSKSVTRGVFQYSPPRIMMRVACACGAEHRGEALVGARCALVEGREEVCATRTLTLAGRPGVPDMAGGEEQGGEAGARRGSRAAGGGGLWVGRVAQHTDMACVE